MKSVRVSKPKPMDRQLEDDVWSLLYKLGFKEFNADRNFTIKVGQDSPARQIDILLGIIYNGYPLTLLLIATAWFYLRLSHHMEAVANAQTTQPTP